MQCTLKINRVIYVELFANDPIEVVKDKLCEGMEWHYPVYEYQLVFHDETTEEEKEKVKEMISELYKDSWMRS